MSQFHTFEIHDHNGYASLKVFRHVSGDEVKPVLTMFIEEGYAAPQSVGTCLCAILDGMLPVEMTPWFMAKVAMEAKGV